MKRISVVLALFAGLTLLAATPANANTSKWRTTYVEDHFTLRCDGFTLRDDYVMRIRVQRVFDNNGDLIRRTAHYLWRGVITNRATGEFVAMDPGSWSTTSANGLNTTHGLVYGIRVPGRGVIVQGTGTRIWEASSGDLVFQSANASHHQDYGDLCAALE